MRGGSGWQLFLYPCIREQMCAGAAHGKYSVHPYAVEATKNIKAAA